MTHKLTCLKYKSDLEKILTINPDESFTAKTINVSSHVLKTLSTFKLINKIGYTYQKYGKTVATYSMTTNQYLNIKENIQYVNAVANTDK